MAREERMTERQKRFADYYIESGNARQSAIRAGYTPNYAARLLKGRILRAYTQERLKAMDDARVASAQEVLAYLTGVMRGEEAGKGDVSRMKAAELLGRRLGAFAERMDADGAPVIVDDIGQQA